ncbi:MAG: hypothetical protein KatS3mg019_0989 [Fimbriimonadales bacterium]|nr:MAG: hypothetical protein KatS3mg019_0670 [Fimbriimonadales bacterium]GIV08898.1 MAG: hypothetical protein KatS3mg019_0989 [Fimbriimonadales bacterium]
MEEMKNRGTGGTPMQEGELLKDGDIPAAANGEGDLRTGEDAHTTAPILEIVEGSVEPTNGAAESLTAQTVQPIPAPPMDWKRFGVPIAMLMTLTIGLVLAIQWMPRPKPLQEGKTLDKIPATLGDWTMIDEYPMSESALNELKPDEYVARIYANPRGEQADLSIIAGSHTGAFHNPQVCFRVQNWEFADNQEVLLNVGGKENPIPARFVRLTSLEGQNRQAVGIYFYATPMGYRSDTSSARIFLLLARLTGMDQQRAYFVRFLKTASGDPERDRAEIQQFAEQALTAMAQTNPEVVR